MRKKRNLIVRPPIVARIEPLEPRRLLSASFGQPQRTDVGDGPIATAVADVNGDGIPDAAVANAGASTVSVLLGNSSAGLGLRADYPIGTQPAAIALGDVTGDGLADVVTGGASGQFIYLPNLGDGTFGAGIELPAGGAIYDLALADMNNDAKLDVVATLAGTSGFGILLNGPGGLAGPVAFTPVAGDARSLALADMDGDGNVDVITANRESDAVTVVNRNADGSVLAQNDYPAPTDPADVAAGDLDDDGSPDLAVLSPTDGVAAVLINAVNGSFLPKTDFVANGVGSELAIADIDGDGSRDVITTATTADGFLVLPGNGSGELAAAAGMGAGAGFVGLSLAEFTGDAKPDLVAVNTTEGSIAVLPNTSTVDVTPPPDPDPAADLTVAFGRVTLPAVFVPGDRGTATLTLTNSGQVAAQGQVTAQLYASTDATLSTDDTLLDTGATLANRPVRLAPGRSSVLRGAFVATGAVPVGTVYLLARVEPTGFTETSGANNSAVAPGTFENTQRFGRLGNRTLRQTRTDADGTLITFSLTGLGTGLMSVDEAGLLNVALEGTSVNSTLSITPRAGTGDGTATIGGITTDGNATLRTLNAPAVTFTGDILLDSAVGVRLMPPLVSMNLGTLLGSSVRASEPMRSLSVASWSANGNNDQSLTTPYVSTVTSRGDFAGNLILNGQSPTGIGLRSANIRGNLTATTWRAVNPVGTIAVAGNVGSGWTGNFRDTLRALNVGGNFAGDLAASNIATINVRGDVAGAAVLAGAFFGDDNRIGTADDTEAAGSIRSIVVGGAVTNAVFAGGLDAVHDGQVNGLDTLLPGGSIGAVSVSGAVDPTTRFVAETLPRRARLGGASVDPAADQRFSLVPIVVD